MQSRLFAYVSYVECRDYVDNSALDFKYRILLLRRASRTARDEVAKC